MTLDYLHCKRHFNSSVKLDPVVAEMFEDNEKQGRIEYIPKGKGCDIVIGGKNGKECGKQPFAIIKYKIDYEASEQGEMYPIDSLRWYDGKPIKLTKKEAKNVDYDVFCDLCKKVIPFKKEKENKIDEGKLIFHLATVHHDDIPKKKHIHFSPLVRKHFEFIEKESELVC